VRLSPANTQLAVISVARGRPGASNCDDCAMIENAESADFVGGPSGVYVDQVRIVYHSVDHPSEPTPRATVLLISDAGMAIDRERLRVNVERLHYTPTDLGEPIHESFVSEERLSNTNWGASGASLELIMWVSAAAAGGIVGGASWDGLKAVGARIRDARGPAWRSNPLDGQDAQRRAVQMAHAAWSDLAGTDLILLSCNLDGDTATVILRAADGSTVTAVPTMTDGDAIGPITRAYPEQP